MARLKGLKDLGEALDNLKAVAEQIRAALEEKQEWLNDKSEKYQESESGTEWQEHLDMVETLLDDIEAMDIPE